MRKYRESLRSGEAFAIKRMPAADIMSLLCADPVPPNEEIEGGVVVHVRGPLEHHSTPFCDNYDDLYSRFCEAVDCAAEKEWCVVLKVDSPGGLVSGLNETVYAMQEEAREHGVDVIVYVDELAASAAYALSCVGDEIVVPESGIVGSVGVISAMTSVSRANEKAGIDVVTITSGDRKSDGHPDVPIDDGAIEAEQARVDDLAAQFFALVKDARGLDASKLEAALFLGKKAVKAGLADRVANWPQLLVDIAEDYASRTDEVAQDGTNVPSRVTGDQMNLKALVTRAEKALAAEKDPKKRQALMADLVAFRSALQAGTKKTYKKMEEQRTEESDDEEEEAEGGNETDREEGGEDDKKEASSHRAESDDDKDEDKKESRSAESEEEESAESEEEEASAEDDKDEEEAIAALLGGLKGPRAQRAIGAFRAIAANARLGQQAHAEAVRLRADRAKDKLHATIDKKLSARFITGSEAAWLKTQSKATVEGFLKTRKGPIVLGEDEAATPPHAGSGVDPHQAGISELGPKQMAVLEAAARGSGVPVDVLIKQYKPTLPNGIKTGGN